MELYTKKYIITGAPGTGKTSLLNVLEQGYDCMEEVSRKVIASEQAKNSDGTPWQDLSKFVELVYESFVIDLKANPQALFTDRSLLDLIAYLEVEGKVIPGWLDQFPYHDHFYKKVFFAPTWGDIYHQDEQRQQTFDYCIQLAKALSKTYDEKGFEMHLLPKVNPEERSIFVKRLIEQKVQTSYNSVQNT